ncbi:uncharacterized protein LOC123519370 [Portunus trituberculatus]|uniref:uncharacterized protein LOC123519370 n=1 Tax=Portunus trituberculatus TaxID=210409 RepID=UPI001E1D1E9D|nr:uncharacterized protein LOC123519370 [Portunus trituberculatus]
MGHCHQDITWAQHRKPQAALLYSSAKACAYQTELLSAEDMAQCWWSVAVVVVAVVVAAPGATTERTEACHITPSDTPGKMDVSCDCMQRLAKVDVSVSTLTINQTGCARPGLEVEWGELEAEVAPSTLVLVDARVYFTQQPVPPTRPASITAVHFINCSFVELPAHAFQGLQQLREVRLLGGAAAVVRRGAFTGLPLLRLVEVVDVSLAVVEGGAWASLPALRDLILAHCSIGNLHPLAVNLSRTTTAEEEEHACAAARSPDRSRVLEVLSSRQASFRDTNMSLPDFGSQLLLYNNSIEVVQQRALSGDAFGFLILVDNVVGHMAASALDMELHSPCEVSAAMLVDNTLAAVEDGTLAALRGRQGAPLRTFLALNNNTWSRATPHAFTLHENMLLFSAADNTFSCRCAALRWAATAPTTEVQQDLQEALVAHSVCRDGSRLAAFLATCRDNPVPRQHTLYPAHHQPPTLNHPHPHPLTPNQRHHYHHYHLTLHHSHPASVTHLPHFHYNHSTLLTFLAAYVLL